MYFKLKVGIPSLVILGRTINFENLEGTQNSIVFKDHSAEEPNSESFLTTCEATIDLKPSKNALPTFESLWQKKLPPGFDVKDLPDGVRSEFEKSGQIENYEFPLSKLSNAVQDLVNKAYKEVIEIINKVVGTACWRHAQKVPIYSYQASRIMWSMDGTDWRMAPANFKVSDYTPLRLHQEFVIDTLSLINNNQTEPLGHELLREAWDQINTSPRSSLVIGVTALETGVKNLIIELVPETDWLIKNLSSPPIYKILDEYLLKLPVRLKVDNRIVKPSKDIVKEIKNWNTQRNNLVHGKKTEIEVVKLKKFLLLVSDILYLCDFYLGFEWAYEHIHPDTRDQFTDLT